MDQFGGMGFGLFNVVLFVVGLVALVLWLFLPFAVFGVKGKLDHMIAIGQRGNKSLADIEARLARLESEKAADKDPA